MGMLNNEMYTKEIRPDGSVRMSIHEFSESRTKQSFKDETDLNVILARHNINLNKLPVELSADQFKDVSNVADFHDANDQLIAAEDAFMRLPAKLRAEFNNDSLEFAEAFHNPDALQVLIDRGIVRMKEQEATPEPSEEPDSPAPE